MQVLQVTWLASTSYDSVSLTPIVTTFTRCNPREEEHHEEHEEEHDDDHHDEHDEDMTNLANSITKTNLIGFIACRRMGHIGASYQELTSTYGIPFPESTVSTRSGEEHEGEDRRRGS